MATMWRMLLVTVMCIAVEGLGTQIKLWPPQCCMKEQFTMNIRAINGDLVSGNSFGYSNFAYMALDFKAQMMAYEGVTKMSNGQMYNYKIVQDFNKASLWSITPGSCSWEKQEGSLGTPCIGDNNGDVAYQGSFNYMGYIPTYTWRTTMWEPNQKGFYYLSVTEDECLPVAGNFGGYNEQIIPKPETVFSGGNFYNYTEGIPTDEWKRVFTVPSFCPPAPPPDLQYDHIDQAESEKQEDKPSYGIFAPMRMLMNVRQLISKASH